jgi:predicted Zn-dependent protease
MSMRNRHFLYALFFGILITSCSTNPVTGKKQFTLMSEGQEISMGQQADPEIIGMFGLYEDSTLQAFIDQKGKEMAAISHRPNLEYHFRIVDSPILNAFAVPGGYVYFTRGIMAHFNNEAEFAGVLGHEIGHITARHSVIQQRNTILAQIGLMAGVIAVPELANFVEPASMGLGLLLLKFGRDAERQSDELGVQYSSKVGYDARYMGKFFSTLERFSTQAGAQSIPDFLSTHPDPGDRFNTVGKLAADWQAKNNATNLKVNRENYLKMIDGLIYGEDPKQGFVENNVFYHPELRFRFNIPATWNHQNSPSQFQMAPKEGNALMVLTLAEGTQADAAAAAFLEKHKLTQVERTGVTVNGLKGVRLVADQVSEQGTLRIQNYFIEYGGLIYSLMGLAKGAEFATFQPMFTQTMQSFSALSDPDKLNRKPERIAIRKVERKQTLLEALREFKMSSTRHEELAILNGMQLSDVVEAGDWIKVVGK